MIDAKTIGMILQVSPLGITELVVGMNEDVKHSPEGFNTSEEASASPSQSCYVVTQIGIGALYGMRVTFVGHISHVASNKVHPQICNPAICVVPLCLYGAIYHFLYLFRLDCVIHSIGNDLTWFTAYHRHDVRIYPFFVAFSFPYEPI